MLFYYCMTALGHMRAQITAQDAGRGMIVATIGKGLFAPSGQLALTITALDGERAELSAAYRAQAWGGDRRILAAFVELLDSLVAQR
jgi:hypothetical protein